MNQRRGLERLAGRLVGELLGRQLAQLVIDQRQELGGGVRVALFDGTQYLGDVGHKPREPVNAWSERRGLSPPGQARRLAQSRLFHSS
jgi:hypothetical protein